MDVWQPENGKKSALVDCEMGENIIYGETQYQIVACAYYINDYGLFKKSEDYYEKASGIVEDEFLRVQIDFNDLTLYFVQLILINPDGRSSTWGTDIRLLNHDLTINSINVTRGYKSLTFSWTGADDANCFDIYLLSPSGSTLIGFNPIQEKYYCFTRDNDNNILKFGTKYRFYISPYNDMFYGDRYEMSAITAPAPPTITLSQKNGYITVEYGVIDTSTITAFYFELYDSGGTCLETTSVNIDSNNQNPSGSIVFTLQCAEGTYTVRAYTVTSGVQCITEDGGSYIESYITVEDSILSLWDWEIGTGSDRDKAYQAITNQGYTREFSYLVWNDLVEKVREAYQASYKDVVDDYETKLDNALMTSSDKVFTATRFNNVRYVIGSQLATFNVDDNIIYDHYMETGSWDMQKGEILRGAYIYALTTKLNEGISNL
jgi:hypothetical protein